MRGIFSPDPAAALKLKESGKTDNVYKDYDDLLNDNDIVFVRTGIESRAGYIRKALESGKHVIYDPPATLKTEEYRELSDMAAERKLIMMSNIKMVHIHVFNQLLWMTQGGLIGDIISFNCSGSRIDKSIGNIFYSLLSSALCSMLKIMGMDYTSDDIQLIADEDGIQFASLNFSYQDARAVINIGDKIRVRNYMEIIGTEGTIRVDGNWWRGSRFELDKPGNDEKEIYNVNYQGNGFKYLIKTISAMMSNERYESMGLFRDEEMKMTEIMEKISAAAKGE